MAKIMLFEVILDQTYEHFKAGSGLFTALVSVDNGMTYYAHINYDEFMRVNPHKGHGPLRQFKFDADVEVSKDDDRHARLTNLTKGDYF